MKEHKQILEKYPLWFLAEPKKAHEHLKKIFKKDVDECISSAGGRIPISELANRLRGSNTQMPIHRIWTISDNWKFEAILKKTGYKINKVKDKNGQVRIKYITR